jgi:hypothetical protein
MTVEQLAIKEAEKFNTWMIKKIHNTQYCSNSKMSEGQIRVYDNYLKLELSYGKRRNKK